MYPTPAFTRESRERARRRAAGGAPRSPCALVPARHPQSRSPATAARQSPVTLPHTEGKTTSCEFSSLTEPASSSFTGIVSRVLVRLGCAAKGGLYARLGAGPSSHFVSQTRGLGQALTRGSSSGEHSLAPLSGATVNTATMSGKLHTPTSSSGWTRLEPLAGLPHLSGGPVSDRSLALARCS